MNSRRIRMLWAIILSLAAVSLATPPVRPGEQKPWATTMPAMSEDIGRKLDAFRKLAASEEALRSAAATDLMAAISNAKTREELRPVFAELVTEGEKAARAEPPDKWRQMNLAYLTFAVGLKCVGRSIPDFISQADEKSVNEFFADRQAKMKVAEQTATAAVVVLELAPTIDHPLASEMATSTASVAIMLIAGLDDPGPACERVAKAMPGLRHMKIPRQDVRDRMVRSLDDSLLALKQRGEQKKAMLAVLARLTRACRKNDPSALDQGTKLGAPILDKARKADRRIVDIRPVRVNPSCESPGSGKIDVIVQYEQVAGRQDHYRTGYVIIYQENGEWVITQSDSYEPRPDSEKPTIPTTAGSKGED